MELVDIGVNLTHRSFQADLAEVIHRAEEAGVAQMVVTGTSLESSRRAAALAETRPALFACTAGVHPHNAREVDEAVVAELHALARRDVVRAIGETGLDYDRDFSPRDKQRYALEAQLSLAAELGMPVFLHERAAHTDFARIVEKHRAGIPRGVIHCFTGDAATLDAYLALDLHIGITGSICDERRGAHLLDIVDRIPADRLMIETDAPFLTPRTMTPRVKKQRNEPAYLVHVLDAVAKARGEPREEVARATTATARAFFGARGPWGGRSAPPGA